MRLDKDDVIIRNAVEQDASQLVEWWADGNIMAHAGFPNGIKTDLDKLRNRIENQNKDSNPKSLLVMIEHEELGTIGEMNYHLCDEDTYEIGIKICDVSARNKGIGAICINLLLNHLFSSLQAKKVILDTNLQNTGAQRFYERIGFRRIKTNYDCWKDQLGRLQSSVSYEMLKTDFKI